MNRWMGTWLVVGMGILLGVLAAAFIAQASPVVSGQKVASETRVAKVCHNVRTCRPDCHWERACSGYLYSCYRASNGKTICQKIPQCTRLYSCIRKCTTTRVCN